MHIGISMAIVRAVAYSVSNSFTDKRLRLSRTKRYKSQNDKSREVPPPGGTENTCIYMIRLTPPPPCHPWLGAI